MLSAINLTKKFGDLLVLDDITETINEGERVVIVGPSGGGKSTFLRCLNCLEDPTAGKIMFDGVDLADLKVDINEQREKMGMVFQQFNLFSNMTVKKNITLAPVQIGVKNMRKAKRKNAFVPLYNKWFEMFGQKHNAKIDKKVEEVYKKIIEANGMELSIFTEMGRFVTGPYGYLVTTVLHEKSTYKNYLGLDASACDLMRPAIYGAYHHITLLGKENAPKDTMYDVTGSLCENNDKFAVDRMLPKAQIGDIAVIHDAGAHGYSMGYNYNGKLKCAELLLEKDGNVRIIRRAQKPEDYFATLDIFPEFRK